MEQEYTLTISKDEESGVRCIQGENIDYKSFQGFFDRDAKQFQKAVLKGIIGEAWLFRSGSLIFQPKRNGRDKLYIRGFEFYADSVLEELAKGQEQK